MAEIRLPLGLQNLLEKEARRRNCTVNELIVHAVRADLEHRDLDLIRPNPTAPRKDPDKAQDRSERLGLPFSTYVQKCIERDLIARDPIVFAERDPSSGLMVAEDPATAAVPRPKAGAGKAK